MAATIAIRVVVSTPSKIIAGAMIPTGLQAIMPTLLIVQVALGQSTKNVSETVSMLQVGSQQVVLDTIISNYNEDDGLRRITHNHSTDNVSRGEQESGAGGIV